MADRSHVSICEGAVSTCEGVMSTCEGTVSGEQGDSTSYWTFDNPTLSHFKSLDEDKSSKGNDRLDKTTGSNVDVLDYPAFPEMSGDLPCSIYYMNERTTKLKPFRTFEELSDYLMNVAKDGQGKADKNELLNTVLKFPLKRMVHYVSMAAYLRHMYEQEQLIDVQVEVGNQKFNAHSIALCCFSDFFTDLFSCNIGKSIPIKIRINGVCPNAFAAFLEFCYTGHLAVTSETALELLTMADVLKVDKLLANCVTIVQKVPVSALVSWLVHGKRDSLLFEPIFGRFLEKFSEATRDGDILKFSLEVFCQALGSDELVIRDEYEVFQTGFRWLVHAADKRLQYTMKLMHLVRFCYMTSEELYAVSATTRPLRDFDKLRELILVANWQATGVTHGRSDPFEFPRQKPRRCYSNKFFRLQALNKEQMIEEAKVSAIQMPSPLMTSTPKSRVSQRSVNPVMAHPALRDTVRSPQQLYKLPKDDDRNDVTNVAPLDMPLSSSFRPQPDTVDIIVVGGFVNSDTSEISNYMERYDISNNHWAHFCKIPQPRRFHAIATLSGYLYMIGGCYPSQERTISVATRTVHEMNISSQHWIQRTDMLEARIGHCVTTVNGRIFVFGGKNEDNSVLSSVECYNPDTDSWLSVTPMNVARFAASVSSLHGNIIVVGGLDESVNVQMLSSVECYDPDADSWTMLRDLRLPRCNASLVTVNENLFLCGGATKSYSTLGSALVSLADIDVYDERTDDWRLLTTMVIPRHDAGVAVAGDRLYIIGGISSSVDRVLQSVECYDTTLRSWLSKVQDLPFPASWVCCASVVSRWRDTDSAYINNDKNDNINRTQINISNSNNIIY